MTTSGSRNFTVSRAEIIQEAVANIGALDPGNTLSAEESARASLRLNLMIKGWMAHGANLWRREEVILFLQSGQQSYTFGVDHFAKASEVLETTLLTGFSAGSMAATLSTNVIPDGAVLGIKLDDGSIHWTLQTSNPSGTLYEVFPVAPSAASAGNAVYGYPFANGTVNQNLNPVKVAFAYRRDNSNDTPVSLMSREEYVSLSRKNSSGPVSQIYHDRQLTSRILVWPSVDVNTDQLGLVVDRVIEDFDSVSDTPDYPVEWMNALMWGLSAELANTYGLPISERNWLKQNAVVEFHAANSFDIEEASVRLEYAE